MEQEKIWNVYQNDADMNVFGGSTPRYKYISHDIKSGSAVLNIGIGKGGLESILCAKGCRVSSLDPDEESVANLRRRLRLDERVRVGYSDNIPYADGEFDVVVMSEVLEHLEPEVLSRTLLEVKRVLKSTGKFIGTVPANEILNENIVVCPCCGVKFHRWGHVQSFSVGDLRDLLYKHQFTTIKTRYRAFPDWARRGITPAIKNIVRWILGCFGSKISSPGIYFVAWK